MSSRSIVERAAILGDATIERAILALLDARGAGKTICPSEAARSLDAARWRDHMGAVRAVARRLQAAGLVEITQRGRVVPLDEPLRGAIRLRRRQ
jgi:ribosomal protein S19E (S16A)